MKNIQDLQDLKGKKVLLRLDLNVPLDRGVIKDETRVNKILPILNFLLNKKAKIIIISHVGRPRGKINPKLSMEPIRKNLEKKIKQKINLITEDIRNIKTEDLFKNSNLNVLILENIRFYPEEESNNLDFARRLATLGDIYVNDAFLFSQSSTSVANITNFLPSHAFIQLNSEVKALQKVTPILKNQLLV